MKTKYKPSHSFTFQNDFVDSIHVTQKHDFLHEECCK